MSRNQLTVSVWLRLLAKGLALHGVQPLHVRLTVIDGERRFVDYLNSKPHKLIATNTSLARRGWPAL